MTRRYVFIPLQYVYFSCTSEDYNNSFQIYTPAASAVSAGRRIICKFFITLQKFPWQTSKLTVLCSQRKMQWPKQVHVRKLYRERESPAESSRRRLVRWNAFGSRAAEYISRLSRFAAVTGLEVQRIAEMPANQSGTAGRRLCLGTAAFLYFSIYSYDTRRHHSCLTPWERTFTSLRNETRP